MEMEPNISRRCKSCGATVRRRAKFCPQCAQALSKAGEQVKIEAQAKAVEQPKEVEQSNDVEQVDGRITLVDNTGLEAEFAEVAASVKSGKPIETEVADPITAQAPKPVALAELDSPAAPDVTPALALADAAPQAEVIADATDLNTSGAVATAAAEQVDNTALLDQAKPLDQTELLDQTADPASAPISSNLTIQTSTELQAEPESASGPEPEAPAAAPIDAASVVPVNAEALAMASFESSVPLRRRSAEERIKRLSTASSQLMQDAAVDPSLRFFLVTIALLVLVVICFILSRAFR